VHDIARAGDAIVAATSEGLSRFDGQAWRPVGDTAIAVRGLADDATAGVLWAATNKGLRWLSHAATPLGDPAAAPVIVAGDVRDVALDAFGRVWALTSSYIAAVSPPNLVGHK
jgi:ligand-binding sensor domain-containing protein